MTQHPFAYDVSYSLPREPPDIHWAANITYGLDNHFLDGFSGGNFSNVFREDFISDAFPGNFPTQAENGRGFFASVRRRVRDNPMVAIEIIGLSLMILLTILGNLLVIVAVACSPTLRLPTHTLIVNLAVADLLLGVTVLPLSAMREIASDWYMGDVLCSLWTSLDVLCCTASIISLCGISVDRYIGVTRPMSYTRVLTKRRVRAMIAVIWILSLAISVGPPLGWKDESAEATHAMRQHTGADCHVNKQLGYVIFSACGSFYIPAVVVIVLYALVYRAAVRHSRMLASGARVTKSDVTLRVHMGGTASPRMSQGDAESMMSLSSSYNGQLSPAVTTPISSRRNPFQQMLSPCGNHLMPPTGAAGDAGLLVTHQCSSHQRPCFGRNGAANGAGMTSEWSAVSREQQGRRMAAAGIFGRAAKYRRQERAAKTLGIVVGGFMLCWSPFFLILPIDAACTECDVSTAFNLSFWLGYFNSCLNPFIYACSSRELRRAFRCALCLRNYDRSHHNNKLAKTSAGVGGGKENQRENSAAGGGLLLRPRACSSASVSLRTDL